MKIGILQTGYAPDALRDAGDYPDMFISILAGHGFAFETYRVVDMEFPDSVRSCDGYVITGSRHGAYEDHEFIAPLERFIRDAFDAGVPQAGICFGHQIMAQALGGKVEKFKGGWSVGPTEYQVGDQTVLLNAWHQDQVVELPPGAKTFASSPFCQYAGLSYGNKAWSVQPHPEYDSKFIQGLIDHRGRGLVPDQLLDVAEDRLAQPVDSARIADQIAAFLKAAHHAA